MENGDEDKVSPASYPESDSDEQETIKVLEDAFADSIKSHIDSRDKVPNHDGHLEIVDEIGSPIGRLVVQVKKLPDKNREKPKKSIKTSPLSYFRAVTEPFILIAVDTSEEVGYWKHISRNWFKSEDLDNQSTKVVHFEDNSQMSVDNEEYVSEWLNLIEENKERIENYEEYEELKRRTNQSIGKEKEEFENIHQFLDEYHRLITGEFSSISEQRYPNVWKFGFGSIQYEEKSLEYTLYPIDILENDAQIREIDASWDEVHRLGASRRNGIPHDNPIKRNPKKYAYNVLQSEIERQIRDRDLDYSGATFLATEYVYPFVDKYSPLLGLDRADEYAVSDVREGYYRYLQFWLTEELGDLLEEHSIGNVGAFIDGYLPKESDDRFEEIHRKAEHQTKETATDPPRHQIHGSEFEQDILEEMIDVLCDSEVEYIERPFNDRDRFEDTVGSTGTVWDWYSDEAIIENVKTYYSNFHHEYRNLLSKNYPAVKHDLLSDKGNLLIVVLNIEHLRTDSNGWCLKQYWLESEEDNLRVEFHLNGDGELGEEPGLLPDTFEYNGVEYPVKYYSSGVGMKLLDTRGKTKLSLEMFMMKS